MYSHSVRADHDTFFFFYFLYAAALGCNVSQPPISSSPPSFSESNRSTGPWFACLDRCGKVGGPLAATLVFVPVVVFMPTFNGGLGGAMGFFPVVEIADRVCHCTSSGFATIVEARAGSGGWKSSPPCAGWLRPPPDVNDDVEAGDVDSRCAGFFATGGAGFPAFSC